MKPVFISHSSQDKKDLSSLFSHFVRQGIPIFIDQKRKVFWDADVRDHALSDDVLVQSIGSGAFNEKIMSALQNCSVFVGLYTDQFINSPGCKDEVAYYLEKCQTELGPKPVLIQSLECNSRITMSNFVFLGYGGDRLNVEQIESRYFNEGSANKVISDIIKQAYINSTKSNFAELQELQQNSAQLHEPGGVIECTRPVGHAKLVFRYIPEQDVSRRGHFISKTPLVLNPIKGALSVKLEAVREVVEVLKSTTFDLMEFTYGQRIFFETNDGQLLSPYGLDSRSSGDLFWVRKDKQIVPMTSTGKIVDAQKAYIYLQR